MNGYGLRPGLRRPAAQPRFPSAIRRAFTLLEVLIAIAIFAMAAIVLASSYINVLNAYRAIGRQGGAEAEVAFARRQLLTEPDVKKIEQGADFESLGRRVQWKAVAEPSATTADLFSVTLTVELASSPEHDKQTFTETFMLLRPTWSDPAERTRLRQVARDRLAAIQQRKKP